MIRWLLCGTAGLLFAAGGATVTVAQKGAAPGSGERVVGTFTACRAIAEPSARLDCFDKAASALEVAVAKKEVQIVDKADVRKARRSLFGFTLPRIALFGGNEDPADEKERAEFTEVNTTVASARQVANGRVEIRLADESEAVWTTTDPMNWPPKTGEKIRIRKGVMGNYFITVAGRSYRGMRVR